MFTLLLVTGPVSRQGGEDSNTAPFRAFVQSDKEFGECRWVNDEKGLVGARAARGLIAVW